MARIRFNSDQIFESIGHKKGPFFPEGFVLDEADVGKALRVRQDPAHAASFLDRWVNLGVAERVDDDVEASDPRTIEIVGAPAAAGPSALGTAKRGGATRGLDDGEQVQKPDFAKLTRAELDDLAARRGVDTKAAKTKEDVIAALETAALLGEPND